MFCRFAQAGLVSATLTKSLLCSVVIAAFNATVISRVAAQCTIPAYVAVRNHAVAQTEALKAKIRQGNCALIPIFVAESNRANAELARIANNSHGACRPTYEGTARIEPTRLALERDCRSGQVRNASNTAKSHAPETTAKLHAPETTAKSHAPETPLRGPKQAKASTQSTSGAVSCGEGGGAVFVNSNTGQKNCGSGNPPPQPTAGNSASQNQSQGSGPPAGATAVHESSGNPPNGIPSTKNVNGKPTACFAYNAAHTLIPVDCSTPGAQALVPAAPAPTTTQTPGRSPQSLDDMFEQRVIDQNQALQNQDGADTNTSRPQQSAAGSSGDNRIFGVKVPLKTDQLATTIEQCNTGKCTCSSFPVSKVPVIDRPYPICDQKCGVDTQCFRDCSAGFDVYNQKAKAYNDLSKKTCPQNYSEN